MSTRDQRKTKKELEEEEEMEEKEEVHKEGPILPYSGQTNLDMIAKHINQQCDHKDVRQWPRKLQAEHPDAID